MSVNSMAVEAVANRGLAPTKATKDDVLAGLTKYIPTESITLYIATASAAEALRAYGITASLTYWFFVGFTPVLLLLIFLRHLAVTGTNWKVSVGKWPWWRIIASTVAFAVWALAVPGNPIISPTDTSGGVLAGLAALLVSTLLNIVAPFFERPQPAAAA